MRTTLRVALESSTILALALFSAALHCALRSLRSQRTAAVQSSVPNEWMTSAKVPNRRPFFLSRGGLLLLRKR